jgi:hypothetical protein
MACVAPDGSLTPQAKAVLGAMEAPALLEDVAQRTGFPLFRIRASVRELAQAGLLEENEGTYRVTAAGGEASAEPLEAIMVKTAAPTELPIDIGIRPRTQGDRRGPGPAPRRQLHALPEDPQLPLERHRPDVQYAAPDVRAAVHELGWR